MPRLHCRAVHRQRRRHGDKASSSAGARRAADTGKSQARRESAGSGQDGIPCTVARVTDSDKQRYEWLNSDSTTRFAGAACMTVVVGMGPDAALSAIGADPARPTPIATAEDTRDRSWVSVSSTESARGEPAAVLAESDGWEGTRTEVLELLSRRGRAASVMWDAAGEVVFTCARRGAVVASTTVPASGAPPGLPKTLSQILLRAGVQPGDPLGVAMEMLETYTGVEVRATPELCWPESVYLVSEPVLGLPVTRAELVSLNEPDPRLVRAVLSAASTACRRLAEWSAERAVENAGLRGAPGAEGVLRQFGRASATRLGRDTTALRNQTIRGARAADRALSVDSDLEAWEQLKHWSLKNWAMCAIAYTAVSDDVLAALGATYCAAIGYAGEDQAQAAFVSEAFSILET